MNALLSTTTYCHDDVVIIATVLQCILQQITVAHTFWVDFTLKTNDAFTT